MDDKKQLQQLVWMYVIIPPDRFHYQPKATADITVFRHTTRSSILITAGIRYKLSINSTNTSWSPFSLP